MAFRFSFLDPFITSNSLKSQAICMLKIRNLDYMYFGGPFLWWVFGNGPQLRTKGRGEEGGREERGGGIVTAAKAPQGSRRVIPCALSSVK